MSELRLADLTRPLSGDEFVRRHFGPEVPFLSAANPRLVETLRGLAPLGEVLALRKQPAMVFGPRRMRAEIPASEASNFLRHGFTLYLTHIERTVPALSSLVTAVLDELGVPPFAATFQMFVAEAGSSSSVHYDHDLNFQILLEGDKTWDVAPNTHIRNPLEPYHPRLGADGEIGGFAEETFAPDRRVPVDLPADATRFVATPGSVVFVPRGWWHQTLSHTRSVALNLVVTGTPWSTAIGRALQLRLAAEPEARAYANGLLADSEMLRAQARATFEEVRASAMRWLAELTAEEASVAQLGLAWAWHPSVAKREIVEENGACFLVGGERTLELEDVVVPFMRRLVALRGQFRWEHVLALVGPALRDELPAHAVMNLLTTLVEERLLTH